MPAPALIGLARILAAAGPAIGRGAAGAWSRIPFIRGMTSRGVELARRNPARTASGALTASTFLWPDRALAPETDLPPAPSLYNRMPLRGDVSLGNVPARIPGPTLGQVLGGDITSDSAPYPAPPMADRLPASPRPRPRLYTPTRPRMAVPPF